MTLQYNVLQAFEATEPISQRKHRFEPGTVVTCDTGRRGATLLIEAGTKFFLVDRSIFTACCEFKNEPGSAYGD